MPVCMWKCGLSLHTMLVLPGVALSDVRLLGLRTAHQRKHIIFLYISSRKTLLEDPREHKTTDKIKHGTVSGQAAPGDAEQWVERAFTHRA